MAPEGAVCIYGLCFASIRPTNSLGCDSCINTICWISGVAHFGYMRARIPVSDSFRHIFISLAGAMGILCALVCLGIKHAG
jgi:hypothetical protein